jgi:phosphatidylglycerol:prolipoprotein diacylglycerol transferase
VHPVLFRYDGWSVSTLGVLYTLAFLLPFLWSLHRAPAHGLSRQTICDVLIIALPCFLVGSRLHYVLLHWPRFAGDLPAILDVFKGGTAQYGGVLLTLAALALYAHARRVSPAALGAVLAPPFFLGLALGRLGCFANGCCYGRPTTSCLGVRFPPGSHVSRAARRLLEVAGDSARTANGGVGVAAPAVHPTQLYAAAGALACLGIVLWAQRRTRSTTCTICLPIGLLGLLRLAVDRYRNYETSAIVWGWPVNSWISLGLLGVAAICWLKYYRINEL